MALFLPQKKLIDVFTYVRYYARRRFFMDTTNITNARSNLYTIVENCIKYNNRTAITTKEGNAVVISEEDYDSLIESLYLAGIPGVYEDIQAGIKENSKDLIEWKDIKK
jgi:antitoxin YefM